MQTRTDDETRALMARLSTMTITAYGETGDTPVRLMANNAPVEIDGAATMGHMRARRASRALARIGVMTRIVRVSDGAELGHTERYGGGKLPVIVLPGAFSAAEDAADLEGM